jgi:hypothetical protein
MSSEQWATDQIIDRIANPAWDELAGMYGVELPSGDQPRERIDTLYALSDDVWNLRGKQTTDAGKQIERQELKVSGDITTFDQPGNPAGEQILRSAGALRMIESQPMGGQELTGRLVLGGAARAAWQRTQLALGFGLTGPAGESAPAVAWDLRYTHATPDKFAPELWGDLIAIGSQRPLGDAERKQFAGIVPESIAAKEVWTEADVMYASARYLLGKMGGKLREHGPFKVDDVGYEAHGPGSIRVITGGNQTAFTYEAPNPVHESRTRADTDDGFKMLRTNAPEILTPESTLAIATNAIYTPFQEASFLNYITRPTGARPEMATFSAADAGLTRKPTQVLPELHSAVRKYKEFMDQ